MVTATAPGVDAVAWLPSLARDAEGLDRSSTAERVADVLRHRITDGDLPPGTRMSEARLSAALGVSRNTLRESFRSLSHEGLLMHQLHRGVFVTELSEAELRDLYRVRRTVECGVLRELSAVDAERLQALSECLDDARAAAAAGRWPLVGTDTMRFHQHLVGLAGSRRLDEIARRVLAELRLAFHVVRNPQELHESYVARSGALLELLAAGDFTQAAAALDAYLHDSEAELVHAYRTRSTS